MGVFMPRRPDSYHSTTNSEGVASVVVERLDRSYVGIEGRMALFNDVLESKQRFEMQRMDHVSRVPGPQSVYVEIID